MTNHSTHSVNRKGSFSTARKLNVVGLVAVASAIVIQLIAGVEYPTIPPGLIILPTAAALVAFGARWRWTSIVGLVVPLFMTVGGLVATPGLMGLLANASDVAVFSSAIIQLLGLLLAIITGFVATAQSYRILGQGLQKGSR